MISSANPSHVLTYSVPSHTQVRHHDVAQQAQRRLSSSDYYSMRSVRCEYHEGVLTLRGRLPSFYLKQIAQTLVVSVHGVETVSNRVDVVYPIGTIP